MKSTRGFIQDMIGSAGGQRFCMAMGAGIVNTVLLWFDKIDATTYRDLTIATVGAFILAKTYEAVAEMRNPGDSKVDPYA